MCAGFSAGAISALKQWRSHLSSPEICLFTYSSFLLKEVIEECISYVFHTHTHTYIIHTHTYYVTAVNRYQFPKADPEGNEKHSYSAHQKEVKGTPKHTDHRKAHDKQEWIMEQESDFDPCVLWGHSFPVSWGHPCFWGPVQLEAGTPL